MNTQNDSSKKHATLMKRSILTSAEVYIQELFAREHSGHDAEHTLRVRANALHIAETEPQCDRFIVELAALLHDTDDHKLFHTENNQNARDFLNHQTLDPDLTEKILDIINCVSFSQNKGRSPNTIEGKIVQDADRLDAIGAIGIARTFAYGGNHNRSISASLEHFEDKLLLLKDLMNTQEGKRMAEKRHTFMVNFLIELNEETNSKKG